MARIGQAGWKVTARQLYVRPTIAELAAFIEPCQQDGKLELEETGRRNPSLPPKATRIRTWLDWHLVHLWEEILGQPEIGPDDNFFSIGGDVEKAARLSQKIEQHLYKRLPVSAILRNQTVELMAQRLREIPSERWSPVIPLQPNGHRRPIYCVAPLSGSVDPYFELARALGNDQPFYGLQIPGLEPGQPSMTTMAELSHFMIQQIIEAHGRPPRVLMGYSSGGLVAFEIALQVKSSREEVDRLFLLDTPVPANTLVDQTQIGRDAMALLLHWNRLPEGWITTGPYGESEEERTIQRVWQRMHEQSPSGQMPLEEFRHRYQFVKSQLRIAQASSLRAYAGNLMLLKASEEPHVEDAHANGERPNFDWRPWVQGDMDVINVPGDHESMVFAPNVDQLAKTILKLTDRLAANA